jgi:hypothetical protein
VELGKWLLHRDAAADASKRLFPDRQVFPQLVQWCKRASEANQMHVDFHEWLWMIMETFVAETRRRQRGLSAFLETLRPENGLAKTMSSVPAFAAALRPCAVFRENGRLGAFLATGDGGDVGDGDAQTGEDRGRRSVPGAAVIRAFVAATRDWHKHGDRARAILEACRAHGLTGWNDMVEVQRNQLRDRAALESRALEASWRVFRPGVEATGQKLAGLAEKFARLPEDVGALVEERSGRLTRASEDLELATAPGAPKLVQAEVERECEAAWADFRQHMSNLQAYMLEAGLGPAVPDAYAGLGDDYDANVVEEDDEEEGSPEGEDEGG